MMQSHRSSIAFMKDDKSFVLLTDTGYVSDRLAGDCRKMQMVILLSPTMM